MNAKQARKQKQQGRRDYRKATKELLDHIEQNPGLAVDLLRNGLNNGNGFVKSTMLRIKFAFKLVFQKRSKKVAGDE